MLFAKLKVLSFMLLLFFFKDNQIQKYLVRTARVFSMIHVT